MKALFVYFIQATNGGPVKIGKSSDPETRLANLQAGNPYPLIVKAVCKGGLGAETQIHKHFASSRLRSEWFQETQALTELMKRLPTLKEVREGKFCPEILNNDRTIMIELYKLGYSYEELGNLYGLSRSRVHQIVSNYDPCRPRSKWTFDRETGKSFITHEANRDRQENPSEPLAEAFDRLNEKYRSIDIVLPDLTESGE